MADLVLAGHEPVAGHAEQSGELGPAQIRWITFSTRRHHDPRPASKGFRQLPRAGHRLGNEPDERVALAVALLVRTLRSGSVCIELSTIAGDVGSDALP